MKAYKIVRDDDEELALDSEEQAAIDAAIDEADVQPQAEDVSFEDAVVRLKSVLFG